MFNSLSDRLTATFKNLRGKGRLSEADMSEQPCVTPVGQPGLVDWSGGRPAAHGIEVRSPSNIPLAVAITGLLGLQAEPAARYLPHPKIAYVPLDGPLAVVALASRANDRRPGVAAFRSAVRASATFDPDDVALSIGSDPST